MDCNFSLSRGSLVARFPNPQRVCPFAAPRVDARSAREADSSFFFLISSVLSRPIREMRPSRTSLRFFPRLSLVCLLRSVSSQSWRRDVLPRRDRLEFTRKSLFLVSPRARNRRYRSADPSPYTFVCVHVCICACLCMCVWMCVMLTGCNRIGRRYDDHRCRRDTIVNSQ